MTAAFITVSTATRCEEGQRLWSEIDTAIINARAGGDIDKVFHALVAYYRHKNGGYTGKARLTHGAPCRECEARRCSREWVTGR